MYAVPMQCPHKPAVRIAGSGSPQPRVNTRDWRLLAALALLLAVGLPARAQYFLVNPNSTAGVQPNGLRIYSVSVFSSYSSAALPYGSDTASSGIIFPGLLHTGFDITSGGSVMVGWGKSFKKSTVSVMYSPSYARHTRYSQWSSLAQTLALSWSTQLGSRWTWSAGISAATSTADVIMFQPNQSLNLASVPSTFEDLSSAVISGRTTDPQLSAALGAGGAGFSPQDQLIFGRRMLAMSINTNLAYARSTRFTVSGGFSGTRAQHLGSASSSAADAYYLIPRTTAAAADLNVSYALTPRTSTSVSFAVARTFTGLVTANTYSFSGALGRRMGEHWFLSGSAGAGMTKTGFSPRRAEYIGNASIGYKTYGHTFVGAASRTMGDAYGVGGLSTLSATGAWNWSRPGHTWGTVAAFSQNKVFGGLFGTSGYQVTAGVHRAITHHAGIVLEYGYGQSTVSPGGLYYAYLAGAQPGSLLRFAHHSVRLSLSWSPQIIINPIPGHGDSSDN